MHLFIKPLTDFIKTLYNDHEHFNNGDSGLDLFCPKTIIVEPGTTKCIDLMIQCEAISDIDDRNVCYYLHCRSSISKTPLRLANSVGIIDSGYRGDIKAAVDNRGNESYQIQKGQRLFQITGRYLEPIEVFLTDELSDSERGNNGFGSTGN